MTTIRSLIALSVLFLLVAGIGARAEALPSRTNSIGMEMVKIPSGSFTMKLETQHRVTLTKDFYLMKYEVTQGEYEALMGKNPSRFSRCGSTCPVEKVSWYEAVAYANALSDKEGLTRCYGGSDDNIRWNKSCNGYRLPTEAEWEYAARAGKSATYVGRSGVSQYAWYHNNSGDKTHGVGRKYANAWGLHDMIGNVWEWVWNWKGDYSGSATDPTGPSSGYSRVSRGGSMNTMSAGPGSVSAALRTYNSPGTREFYIGFRLARTAQ